MVMTMYCVFDPAGRSWVKMKKYQRSMKEAESRFNYRRSGSTNRNWRQRKVIRAYQDSWNQRCRFFFCCMNTSDRNKNSFSDIAKLLSDFFRDLDVVPSDVVAGLILLRKFQKVEREAVVRQVRTNLKSNQPNISNFHQNPIFFSKFTRMILSILIAHFVSVSVHYRNDKESLNIYLELPSPRILNFWLSMIRKTTSNSKMSYITCITQSAHMDGQCT